MLRGFAVLLGLALSACASTLPLDSAASPSRARFDLARDAFAFPNVVRAEHPTWRHPFANYCIVMARSASQFYRFARFDPGAPPVAAGEYTRLTREILDKTPWAAPLPDDRRVVIPGYADLHEFSRAQGAAIKAAFGSNIPSMVQWRNWRVAFALSPSQQAGVAHELVREADAERPAPLMITNFPNADLVNHTVLVYDYRRHDGVIEFLAYDPNDPDNPLSLYFDRATRGFWVEPLTYGPPGRIRAFRLYTSLFF